MSSLEEYTDSHGMNVYTSSSRLNSMFSIGIIMLKENTLKITDRRFSSTEPPRYFLYGATYWRSIFQKAFICQSTYNGDGTRRGRARRITLRSCPSSELTNTAERS